jgi:hypothetical protein
MKGARWRDAIDHGSTFFPPEISAELPWTNMHERARAETLLEFFGSGTRL